MLTILVVVAVVNTAISAYYYLRMIVVMFFLVGCLSMLLGLVAELTVRTYYESQGKRTYALAPDETE